ncbi:serine hydrolase [Streptomyces angustmyceticus]|uniref:Peptidase S11 D-alanyl-D-alanine carboxypeptidase A N-terminal domain-containing protein n=1 Tax=Streptomyces angustmyceticus TaxID=285578 RepID=A0A5J4LQQ6_9ACTN|nr:serine hydrolase [Streptomyces angustmyceticus]GES33880.1 hypothetical protein San01_63680 [Streptomyces angustmyceticus]
MAGESPDKSDKKQSSGETARSKRDPRLSAFRGEPAEPAKESGSGTDSKPEKKPEAAAAPKPAAKSGSAAKPGSGTKSRSGVKSGSAAESKSSAEPESVVEPESAGSSAASAGADASKAPEAPQEAAEGAGEGKGGEGGGDDRLRAAVAAWVSGKSDESDEGAEGAEAEGAQDAEGGDGRDADKASAGSGDLGEGADGGVDVDGGTGTDEGADGAVAKPSVEPEAAAEPKAEDAARSDVKGSGDAGSGGKAGAKADAEVGGKADGKADGKAAAKGAGVAESAPRTESGAEPKAEAESKTATKVVDQPTAVFKTVGPQKGKPDEKGGAAADGKGKGKSDGNGDGGDEGDADVDESAVDEATRVFAVAKLKGKGAAAGAVDQATTAFKINAPAKSKDAAKGKDATESKGATEDKAAGESGSKAEAKPGSAAAGKGKSGAKGGADAKTGPKADAKADAETDAKSDAKAGSKAGEKADAKAGDKDDAKPGSKADSKAPGTSERDSERTSQFVALKSADDGTAGKSLGKTAPRTPARTSDKAGDKAAEKPTEKSGSQAAAKTADKAADKPAGKPEDKAAGALPATKPAKPAEGAEATAPSKAADRPGAMPSAATGATAAGAPGALPESERTKQEPLPPLDLLAQLTNTPPPPETPLRTVVRRFKIWTPLAVLLVIIFVVAQAVRPLPDPTLTVGDAKSSFTFEGGKLAVPWPEHGQAAVKVVGSGDLGTFGPQKPVPTASVAKIMTAYVILRDHPLKKDDKGPDIEVDAKAVTEGGSRHESRIEGLKAGQKFSQQDMLKMLMIPSGNNIARLLARWDTKSANEGAFVKKMNAAAKELGMKNTTYTDPSGLDPKTVSTAVDQLKLAEAVMKFDAFRPIVAMPNAEIRGLPGRINNNNDDLLLAGLSIKGIKTGSSTAAGGTLSWAAYKTVDGKDRLILGTMMDQHFKGLDPDASNSLTMVKNNSKQVVQVVRDALTSAPAVKKGQVVGYVDDGLNGRTPVVATKDLKAVGVPGQKLKLSVGSGGKTIPHTAKAGTEVGVLTVGNGESTQKVPVALQKDLVEPTFGAKLIRIT